MTRDNLTARPGSQLRRSFHLVLVPESLMIFLCGLITVAALCGHMAWSSPAWAHASAQILGQASPPLPAALRSQSGACPVPAHRGLSGGGLAVHLPATRAS